MCENPFINHEGKTIWCRKCRRCLQNRVNDWVGRCVAESRYATSTDSVTLTYGHDENGNADHINSAVLIYRDVQAYFKRLRKDGYKFKYLVAGEYGSKKRRAHWHMIIFWDGKRPEVEYYKNFNDHHYWTAYGFNGHTFWEPMTPMSVWYVCKYIQKEQGEDEGEAMLRMSKKPPIGHEYFQQWARDHVEQGLPPRSFHYSFHDVKHKDGKTKEFYMHGVTADNFLKEYCRYFVEKNNSLRFPQSEFLEEWIDGKYAKYYETDKFMREGKYGKTVIEALKKQELELRAKAHGGIKIYSEGVHPWLEPVALCHDGTSIQYGDPSNNQIETFLRIIQD